LPASISLARQGVEAFARQRFAEGGIACDPLLHQLLETQRQCHLLPPLTVIVPAASAALVVRPQRFRPLNVALLLALLGAACQQDRQHGDRAKHKRSTPAQGRS
jgi:hypothetical protein